MRTKEEQITELQEANTRILMDYREKTAENRDLKIVNAALTEKIAAQHVAVLDFLADKISKDKLHQIFFDPEQ